MASLAHIDFYQLLGGEVEELAAQLIEKCRAASKKAILYTTKDATDAASRAIWTVKDLSFYAHGIDNGEGHDIAPIWISSDVSQNQIEAEFALVTNSLSLPDYDAFERVFILFDGRDAAALDDARKQWKTLSEQFAGKCRYFAKTDDGKWQQKA